MSTPNGVGLNSKLGGGGKKAFESAQKPREKEESKVGGQSKKNATLALAKQGSGDGKLVKPPTAP